MAAAALESRRRHDIGCWEFLFKLRRVSLGSSQKRKKNFDKTLFARAQIAIHSQAFETACMLEVRITVGVEL